MPRAPASARLSASQLHSSVLTSIFSAEPTAIVVAVVAVLEFGSGSGLGPIRRRGFPLPCTNASEGMCRHEWNGCHEMDLRDLRQHFEHRFFYLLLSLPASILRGEKRDITLFYPNFHTRCSEGRSAIHLHLLRRGRILRMTSAVESEDGNGDRQCSRSGRVAVPSREELQTEKERIGWAKVANFCAGGEGGLGRPLRCEQRRLAFQLSFLRPPSLLPVRQGLVFRQNSGARCKSG